MSKKIPLPADQPLVFIDEASLVFGSLEEPEAQEPPKFHASCQSQFGTPPVAESYAPEE